MRGRGGSGDTVAMNRREILGWAKNRLLNSVPAGKVVYCDETFGLSSHRKLCTLYHANSYS